MDAVQNTQTDTNLNGKIHHERERAAQLFASFLPQKKIHGDSWLYNSKRRLRMQSKDLESSECP